MIDDSLLAAEEKMDKAIEVAKEDFATIRTGRANPAMFTKVLVEYYGTPTPLQQLASFNTPEPRSILISPFDMTSMAAIERAIRDSDLGVNPSNDGKTIRVVLPLLTEERRREYIKLARHKAEEARVSVRNVRRRAKEELDRIARTRATLCIFLSVGKIAEVSVTLSAHYGPDCPAAVVYRASWPEELLIRGTLTDIALKTEAAGIRSTALIVVGEALARDLPASKLYNAAFTHGFREGKKP